MCEDSEDTTNEEDVYIDFSWLNDETLDETDEEITIIEF